MFSKTNAYLFSAIMGVLSYSAMAEDAAKPISSTNSLEQNAVTLPSKYSVYKSPANVAVISTEKGIDKRYLHLNSAQSKQYADARVRIGGVWQAEYALNNFNNVFTHFNELTGIEVFYDFIPDIEKSIQDLAAIDELPDIIQLFQPGLMKTLAEDNKITTINWFADQGLVDNYPEGIVQAASVGSDLYAVYFKINLKSMVFYRTDEFDKMGYHVPKSWDELLLLSKKIVDDGNGSSLCVAAEAQEASGWPLTDWVEDVILRFAGADIYDQWVAHEIPFDHPEIINAINKLSELFFSEKYVFGGSNGIAHISVNDGALPMFYDLPVRCWMHKQSLWISGTWPRGEDKSVIYDFGVNMGFFPLPGHEEGVTPPLLISGSFFVATNDKPSTRAVMEFLASTTAAEQFVKNGAFLSPNKMIPQTWYPKPYDELSRLVSSSENLRFDGSDLMPPRIGSDLLWLHLMKWVETSGGSLEESFKLIDKKWDKLEIHESQ